MQAGLFTNATDVRIQDTQPVPSSNTGPVTRRRQPSLPPHETNKSCHRLTTHKILAPGRQEILASTEHYAWCAGTNDRNFPTKPRQQERVSTK